MGIERFFYSLAKNKIIKNEGIITGLTENIKVDHLYIDFNSIVYNIANDIESKLNYLLYDIILNKNNLDEKSREILKEWKYELTEITIDSYKKYFSTELIDTYALNMIKQNILHISTKLIDKELVQTIFVAIDGVPQMGKIIEQKKRRYNGYLLSKFKNKIYKEYFEDVSDRRKIYETNKVTYDRGKIISWTKFMKNIKKELSSDEFLNEMKTHNINLKEFVLSHQDVYGEGEKKIIENVLEKKYKGRYAIYSPDADVIILGIIMLNTINNDSTMSILRFNQQSIEYDLVNINILCDSIYEYVVKYAKINKKYYNKINITNDMCFIFTLFGNDFVPKMESIDVRNDIQSLIEVYCYNLEYVDKNNVVKPRYLIFLTDDGLYRINFVNFYEIIKNIANIEDSLLIDTYMANKYKNYSYSKRELDVDKLFPILSEYIININKLFNELRTGVDIDSIINKYDNIEFIRMFLIIEAYVKEVDKIDEKKKRELFRNKILRMMTELNMGKKIRGKFKMQLFDHDNVDSEYHKKNMRENLPHPKMEITEYDKNIYKLEKRIGEYEIKLNATNFDLGGVSVGINQYGDYKMTVYSKLENIIDYYDTFFNISYKKEKKPTKTGFRDIVIFDSKIDDLIEDYLKGLFWVFDNYFNTNYNSKNVSTWFYKHHRVPLLYQVREYLFKYINKGVHVYTKKMTKIFTEVSYDNKNFIDKNKFMTTLEQYIYVTPKNKHIDVPDEYKKIINDDTDSYPDMDELSEKIWNGTDNTKLIESKRISYFAKCNLKSVKYMDYNEFMKNIKSLRTTVIEYEDSFIKIFN
jgi:5'-3' exonuclease